MDDEVYSHLRKKDMKKWAPTVYELASQVKMLNTVLKKNDLEE